MQLLILCEQIIAIFSPVGVLNDAFHRTHQLTLRFVFGADTFGALHWVDDVERISGGDRFVRTHRLASIAGRAGIVDYQAE